MQGCVAADSAFVRPRAKQRRALGAWGPRPSSASWRPHKRLWQGRRSTVRPCCCHLHSAPTCTRSGAGCCMSHTPCTALFALAPSLRAPFSPPLRSSLAGRRVLPLQPRRPAVVVRGAVRLHSQHLRCSEAAAKCAVWRVAKRPAGRMRAASCLSSCAIAARQPYGFLARTVSVVSPFTA
jgi:hypothetical protein